MPWSLGNLDMVGWVKAYLAHRFVIKHNCIYFDKKYDNTVMKKFIKIFSWILVFIAVLCFLQSWLAPDACLDSGGSFDYIQWQCSFTNNHPYIEVYIYQFTSFWISAICIFFAIIIK